MRTGIFEALSLVALIGCASDPPPARTLTASDITPIPPGTAIGSLFSGNYYISAGEIEACHCRVGICATARIPIGDILTVVQTDGTLQISRANTSNSCSGGVDSDGSFRCNFELVQPDNTEFQVANGQFVFNTGSVSS